MVQIEAHQDFTTHFAVSLSQQAKNTINIYDYQISHNDQDNSEYLKEGYNDKQSDGQMSKMTILNAQR